MGDDVGFLQDRGESAVSIAAHIEGGLRLGVAVHIDHQPILYRCHLGVGTGEG